jgi:6,7-dimethyl-8-ribityllumazine synthase
VSGAGAPSLDLVNGSGVSLALVTASWHSEVMGALLAGAQRAAQKCQVANCDTVRVPGTFELPVAAATLANSGRYQAIVALGVVIRGDTPHFDYVCQAATYGLTKVSVESRIPVGFGVLTCDTEDQARARSGLPGSTEDKGFEAVWAAVSTAVTLHEIMLD